jgi:ubiquinone/menaquinone biosynthesis C-methylase UbiE
VPESTLDVSGPEAYEAVLVPAVFKPWAELLVREAEIKEGLDVLDVACGTGIVARCAARAGGARSRVAGADLDPAAIEVAKAVSISEGLKIDYRCASASELPFESGSFDAVLCQQGLQYFPDIQRAMSEFHRVLRPCGRAVAATWTDMKGN